MLRMSDVRISMKILNVKLMSRSFGKREIVVVRLPTYNWNCHWQKKRKNFLERSECWKKIQKNSLQ
jgi:hypothetical protein